MHRRELFERTAGMAGLAALLAACGADPAEVGTPVHAETSTTVPLPVAELDVDELAFASAWKSLIDAEMIDFGASVMGVSPGAVDHAREALSDLPEGSSVLARDELFAACCRNDSRAGDVVVVDGWMVPITLAGLAGALSQFKS